LYKEDFDTLATLLPPEDPADVNFHLTVIDNGISFAESGIVKL
jgi:hypothetical protein